MLWHDVPHTVASSISLLLGARALFAAVFVMSLKTMFNCAHTGNVRGCLARTVLQRTVLQLARTCCSVCTCALRGRARATAWCESGEAHESAWSATRANQTRTRSA